VSELVDALREILHGDARVVAAWLFGSEARGTARPDSDVDVAVLLDHAPRTLMAWPADLADLLARRVARPVQLVPVNDAPADLVRRVLRDGVLLVQRDRSARIAFEVKKRNEYFDLAPMWRRIRGLPPGSAP
jgi:predicted nucleotidyltransferase